MIEHYWQVFVVLGRKPFEHEPMVWGVVPLYFGWLLNELTSAKASFNTATQTGFGFLWAGAHWSWQYLHPTRGPGDDPAAATWQTINVIVTLLVLFAGVVALISGLRRRFPRHCSFLGHTRFSAYFMIAMFPIQSGYLRWSWDRLAAILIFAVPIWLLFHFGLMPLRRGHRRKR